MLSETSSQLWVMDMAPFLSVSFPLESPGEREIQETDPTQMWAMAARPHRQVPFYILPYYFPKMLRASHQVCSSLKDSIGLISN